MENQTNSPNKIELFEKESVLMNNEEMRESVYSIFEEEKRLLSNINKRFIAYFSVFAISEYLMLYILQRYFYIHKSSIVKNDQNESNSLNEFEVSKYFWFRFLGIIFIILNKKKGIDNVYQIVKDFNANRSFAIFLSLDIAVIICTLFLIQIQSVASILVMTHSRVIYQFINKSLRRYQLRNVEITLIAVYLLFLSISYFLNARMAYWTFGIIILIGIFNCTNDEIMSTHISLSEWEILRFGTMLIVIIILLFKALLSTKKLDYSFEISDMIIAVLIVTIDYLRCFTIKRIHKVRRENSSRIYYPLVLVFITIIGLIIDTLALNDFLTMSQFFGIAVFGLALIWFYKNDLMRLFKISISENESTKSERLV